MPIQSRIFTFLLLIIQIYGNCDNDGTYKPADWITNPSVNATGCDNSYIKIDIFGSNKLNLNITVDYILKITDSKTNTILAELENEFINADIHLASKSNDVLLEVKVSDSSLNFPYVIEFEEVKAQNFPAETAEQNGTITEFIKPNSKFEFTMNGFGEVQTYDVSWNMENNLGFVALENGNGRMTLFTSPKKSNFKVKIIFFPCFTVTHF